MVMATRKSIGLGDGLQREVTYDELKKRLKKGGANPALAKRILETNFPAEFAQEQKLARDAEQAARDAQLLSIQESRWRDYLGESSLTPSSISHQEVVSLVSRRRSDRRPKSPFNRVTDFANWIYEAMPYYRPRRMSQKAGKKGEREVAKLKRLLRPISEGYSDWKLIDKDPLDGKPKPREISLLKIGDDSLFGAPDYVYHNPGRGQILIVEVKVSNPQSLPADGWPNLRAQLWAYGNIDFYLNLAHDIVLIGEVWRKAYSPRTKRDSYVPLITYRWRMSDPVFCNQNEELFALYEQWVSNGQAEGAWE